MANQIRLKRASGSDPSASDLVTGELAVRTDTAKLFTKKDDNSVVEIGGISDGDKGDITVSSSGTAFTIDDNAVTYAKMQDVSATNRVLGRDSSGGGIIEEITPANLRTMLNVADGATNVTNTNQLTNGAGFITATLTNEQVQDIVGGMVTGNTETGITVTYQDGDGTLDFVVGTLNQDTTGNAATATALETARNIGGVSFDGTGNINLPGVNTSGNQNTSGNAATATKLATARTIAGVSFDGSANISLNNNAITNGAGYITSADGGNAATLDSIDSSQFLRSDAADTATGLLTLSGGIAVSGRVSAPNINALNGGTVTIDFTASNHHAVNLNQNSTLTHTGSANTIGQSGSIFLTQDGTGSRTLSFNSGYKFAGGTAPTISTAANAVDRLDYVVKASNVIHAVVTLDVK
jgi:hypothetical protein